MNKPNIFETGARQESRLKARSSLSPEQLKIVEMPADRHCMILGPAGSGKTQTFLHRGAYLAGTSGALPSRYRLFVFNEMAGESIKSGIRLLGLPEESVTTIDHWCRLFYEEHISRNLPRIYVNLRLDYPIIRSEVLQALEDREDLRNILEFALVDDGQDLSPDVFEILQRAAKHLTVFADFQQKLIENKTSETFLLETLKRKMRKDRLSGIYRNAPPVAQLASYFLSEEDSRRKFLAQIAVPGQEKKMPLFYVAPSEEAELDQLAATVHMRQSLNENVGIVVSSNRLLHEFAKDLKERGVEIEKVIESDAQNVLHGPYDLENDIPKIMTYQTAKGLTFDSVFLPRLTESSFSPVKGEARERMLFVGVTRARQWVHLSTVRGSECAEIGRLKAAEADGHLVII
ncbi:MAG: UvrD-helicase domain-containing protein [Candidatus Aminicenantales bacterium]